MRTIFKVKKEEKKREREIRNHGKTFETPKQIEIKNADSKDRN